MISSNHNHPIAGKQLYAWKMNTKKFGLEYNGSYLFSAVPTTVHPFLQYNIKDEGKDR